MQIKIGAKCKIKSRINQEAIRKCKSQRKVGSMITGLPQSDAKVDSQRGYAKTAADLKLPNNPYPKKPPKITTAPGYLSHSGGYQRPIQEEIKIFPQGQLPLPQHSTQTLQQLQLSCCLSRNALSQWGYGDRVIAVANVGDKCENCTLQLAVQGESPREIPTSYSEDPNYFESAGERDK